MPCGVIDLGGRIGVDDLDVVAIDDQRRVFFINGDAALEGTVHRVATQQAGPLFQIILAATHHDGAQAQQVTAAGLLDHDARQQAADTPEAIQDDVLRVAAHAAFDVATDDVGQLTLEEGGDVRLVRALEGDGQLADVDVGRAQVELDHRAHQREGIFH